MYLALYRKWRPKTFEDVISQPHITTTLKNEVTENRISHAYLFTGSRGTGKTTCSQILAKAINCPNSTDGNPCMECEICKGIEDGSILDVVEMDAASNSRVEDVRFLREEAYYTPSVCKYRVYIIDEVHMLSQSAFNALLKIMEEPPSHVVFILATTETHKVPITILSRCQRFDFKRIKTEDITSRLLDISNHETFTLNADAAEMIARLADGGMRDALSLLDQCVAYSDNITPDIVTSAVGISKKEQIFSLINSISAKDSKSALEIIQSLYDDSCDFTRLCEELILSLRNMMVIKASKEPATILNCLPDEINSLNELSSKYKIADVLHALTVLSDCLDRLTRSTNKRTELEMALIKLCSPELDSSNDALVRRISQLESMIKSGNIPAPTQSDSQAQQVEQKTPDKQSEPAPKQPANATPTPSPDPNKFVPVVCWSEILQSLSQTNMPLWSILNGSQAYEQDNLMIIDSPNPMFATLLKQQGSASALSEAVTVHTGKKYKFSIRKSAPIKETNNAPSPLDEFVKKVQESGVNINVTE